MSKTNLPGFTADSSLCKARERYAAVKCFAQTERGGIFAGIYKKARCDELN